MATYVVPHRGGWKHKRAVPRDLQPIVGRKQWVKYLGHGTRREAEAKSLELVVQQNRLIKKLRRLRPETWQDIIAQGGAAQIGANAQAMAITLPFVEAAATYYGEDEYDLEDDEQAEAALAVMKSRQMGAKRRAEIDAAKKLIAALEGKPQPEPDDTHGLLPLLEAWIKESNPKQDTVRMARYRLGRFADVVGREHGPRQITRAHVQKYRDHLRADTKLKRSTKAKFLEILTTLFNVGMSVGLVDTNPALKVKLPREKTYELGKQPFSGEQVALIFKKMVEDKQTTDFCWMIRLLAYHGCRSGELAQIRCADVTKIAGITVMRLYGDIKNPESVRDVPLHPACEDFVTYAQKRAKTGERVFQSFPSWKGRYGEKFQKNANLWLRTIGIVDRKLTMHSLRHTWRTMAREVDMPESVSRSIMGHSLGSDDHASYGGLPSLAKRAEWIARVDPLKG